MGDNTASRDMALVRKFIYAVADCDGDTPYPEAVKRAVGNWEQTRDRLATLEAVVETDPTALDYEQMTKEDKVRRVRQHLVEEARGTGRGRAAMNYNEVKWLFDGQISPGHCYNLMEHAGDMSGFEYETFEGDRQHRVTVNTGRVNADAGFHSLNKASTEEGGD